MLESDSASPALPTAESGPVELIGGRADCGWLLVCDHASNFMPPEYGALGLDSAQLERHIAYDIGAAALTRCLAARLGAPAVLSRFSRLLIDPNRGPDDPTLIMRLSDGAVVPGNARLDESERRRRIERFYAPYDGAIATAIERAISAGNPPAIVSIHSFTPHWRGTARPWQVGILWDEDPWLARPLIAQLGREGDLTVGDNEPYSGKLEGDTMYRHGTRRGLAHALIEVRQDLISAPDGIAEWCERLGDALNALAGTPGLNDIRHYGSATCANRRDEP